MHYTLQSAIYYDSLQVSLSIKQQALAMWALSSPSAISILIRVRIQVDLKFEGERESVRRPSLLYSSSS